MRGTSPILRVFVTVALDEIQRIRDELNRYRHRDADTRRLFSQVHALYERLAKEARSNHRVPPQEPRLGPTA